MTSSFECAESISRRSFLRASAILTFAALPEMSFAATPGDGRLVVILLRGGMDGLFAVPPIGDPSLKGKRRHLVPDGTTKLDGLFALHPSLSNISQFYRAGQAVIVHATSNGYTGRSHFQGQNLMETGADQPYALQTGWLGRALDISGYTSVAISLPVPLILRGRQVVESRFPTWISTPPPVVYEGLGRIWSADADTAEYGAQLAAAAGQPRMTGYIGMGQDAQLSGLAQVAAKQLARSNGPRVAVLDHVGFDTHASEPGEHSDKLRDVDQAIAELRKGLPDDIWRKTLIVTVTEFGRTVAENGSWGSDHGWASCAFVVGGALRKSGVVTDWPGLKAADLFEGRDLKATIDMRSLYSAVLTATLGIDPDVVRRDVLNAPRDDRFEAYL
ncbi:MAG: DUF1501 domain-containing protein [Bauldia sp.]